MIHQVEFTNHKTGRRMKLSVSDELQRRMQAAQQRPAEFDWNAWAAEVEKQRAEREKSV
jgi:hypothetical protein